MTNAEKLRELKEKVSAFQMLTLPGQPQTMHMGTSYLMHDLLIEVMRLNKELEK